MKLTVRTDSTTQITHHCPTCESAQNDVRMMQERLQRLIDANPDLAAAQGLCDKQADILSRVAVALRGPEPPQTKWSHADLPERAERAVADAAHYRKRWADSVLMHTDAVTQRDDLRARLARASRLLDQVAEYQAFAMPEFEQARALLRKEAK